MTMEDANMARMRCMNCMEEYNEKQNKCPHCGYVNLQPINVEWYLPQETTLQRRYLVGNVLRENENEIIYIGWDSVLEKRIAIKEYYPVPCVQRAAGQKELSYQSEEEKAQFMRGLEKFISEAQQLARFREDTGVIRIYDSFEENGTAYTIIEYTDGLRAPIVTGKSEVISKWRQQKKAFHIGWGISVVAILVLLVLIFVETGDEVVATDSNTIPDVVGMSYQQAETELEALGVRVEREKYSHSDTVEADVITCQSIPEGTKLEESMIMKVVVTSAKNKEAISQQAEIGATQENSREDTQEDTEKKTTAVKVTTEEETTTDTSTASQSTERTTSQTVKKTTQQTTEKTTQKKTEKKTTEKKTEKKTSQEKATERATTEKATTEEEVIVIED